jgi:hypothetical protein
LYLFAWRYLHVIKNKTNYFPRDEINSLSPNPEVASLMSFAFEDITDYKTVDQWVALAENIYARPAGPAIVETVKSLHPDNGHPRILITEESVSRLKQKIKEDPLYQQWFADVKKEADQILILPCVDEPKRHELQNRQIVMAVREKALELAFVAYQNPRQRAPYQNYKISKAGRFFGSGNSIWIRLDKGNATSFSVHL